MSRIMRKLVNFPKTHFLMTNMVKAQTNLNILPQYGKQISFLEIKVNSTLFKSIC